MSAFGGKADEIRGKADIGPVAQSIRPMPKKSPAVGGGASILLPLLASLRKPTVVTIYVRADPES